MNHIEQIKAVIAYANTEAQTACIHHRPYAHLEEIASRLSAIVEQMEKVEHSDDEAVNSFCAAMKTKLARKRAEGRGGWETCDPNVLAKMLVEHIPKGDPVDIANFAMFLWHIGSGNELKEVSLAAPQVPDGMVPAQTVLEWMEEAKEDIQDWACYASEYFREKHNLAADLVKMDMRIAVLKRMLIAEPSNMPAAKEEADEANPELAGRLDWLVRLLREQAAEIANDGHAGWGNTMLLAADEIERFHGGLSANPTKEEG